MAASVVASAPTLASIGDHGVLNERLTPELSEVWIDHDSSWLDFNDRVLAEALDARTPPLERLIFRSAPPIGCSGIFRNELRS